MLSPAAKPAIVLVGIVAPAINNAPPSPRDTLQAVIGAS
jgi:hypothetical protein